MANYTGTATGQDLDRQTGLDAKLTANGIDTATYTNKMSDLAGMNSSASEIDKIVSSYYDAPLKINNYLIVGASIMAMSFPATITKNLIDTFYGVNCNFHNRAVGGWKTSDLKSNIDSILADYSYDDMLVFIHIGGNNIGSNPRYFSTDVEYINSMRSDIEYIVNAIINKGYIPILSEVSFRNYDGVAYLDDTKKGSLYYNKYLYKPLIKKYSSNFSFDNCDSFMQMYNLLFNNLDYLSSDFVHPSVLGMEKIRDHFLHTICYYNYFGIKPEQIFKKTHLPIVDNVVSTRLYHLTMNDFSKLDIPYINGIPTNSTIENIKDSNSVSSTISVITSGFTNTTSTMPEVFNDSGFLLDYQFKKFYYLESNKIGKITISGLNDFKIYTIRVSGLRLGNELRETNIEINGVHKSYITTNPDSTVDKMSGVLFENLTSQNGIIEIFVTVKTGTYGYVAGLDIIEL